MSDREVIRCVHCLMNQFVMKSRLCRKCHKAVDVVVEPVAAPVAAAVRPALELDGPPVDGTAFDFEFWTAFVLWDTRESLGLSQGKLSKRMNVVRTYVSKIERAESTPSVKSFQRFCSALETSPAFMVRKIEFLVTGH